MSTYPYQKEIKESVIDGGLLTLGFFASSWIMGKCGMSKPIALTTENFGKSFAALAATDAAIAYAKKEKYIPS